MNITQYKNPLSDAQFLSPGGGILPASCIHHNINELKRPDILIAISDDQSFAHTSREFPKPEKTRD